VDTDAAELLTGFPTVVAVPVMWGDQDAFGHVNNTVYLRWCEYARVTYCCRVGLSGPTATQRLGPILASFTCHFRQQLAFPDTVHIGAQIIRIGRSSLTMRHSLISDTHGMLAAEVESTLVVFDYTDRRPHPVPVHIREAINRMEGKEL